MRMPGTTRTSRSAHGSVAGRSGAAQTMPAQPVVAASSQRCSRTDRPAVSSLVRTVTPSTPGASAPTAAAPSAMESTAARNIASPPEVCTVTHRAPDEPSTRAALPTVLGMSCSFKSQNTRKPASTKPATASGPAAENNSRPTLTVPNHGASAAAVRRAATRSSTSSTRQSASRRCAGAASSDVAP